MIGVDSTASTLCDARLGNMNACDQHGPFCVLRTVCGAQAHDVRSVGAEVPCVSVLLSVHNAAATVEQAVHSVLAQSVHNLELLIADDGSTDSTPHILEALAVKDSRIVVVRQPNMGLTRSLNRLFALSRGQFVARQDADDLWLPDKLQAQLDRMQAEPELVLLGTQFMLDDGSGECRPGPQAMSIEGDRLLRAALACYNPFMHASILMRSEALRRCGGYDERYDVAQDYELWLRLAAVGEIDVLPQPLCIRREQNHSTMYSKIGRQRRNVLLAKVRSGVWRSGGTRSWYFLLKDAAAVLRSAVHLSVAFLRKRSRGAVSTPHPGRAAHGITPQSQCASSRALAVLFCTVRADWGGGPEHLFQLLRHLPHDFVAHVACPSGDAPYADRFCELIGEGRCVNIPHRKFSLTALWRLIRHIRAHRIDVLHSHGKGAGLYVRLAALVTGRPCVHTFHGIHFDQYGTLNQWAYVMLERLLGGFTTTAIAVSDSERRLALAKRFCSAERMITIPNGVVISLDPVSRAAEPPFPIVHISRFDVAKNSEFINVLLNELQRMGRHRDFTFILVGDGEGRACLRDALAASGLEKHVFFAGWQQSPALFFAGALCYFSCSRWEGMPLSVMEAMAQGLPVVASDVRGNSDVVKHGLNGLLYPADSASAAAKALCQLADDPALANNLACVAHRHALKHLDVRHMAEKTYGALRVAALGVKEQ